MWLRRRWHFDQQPRGKQYFSNNSGRIVTVSSWSVRGPITQFSVKLATQSQENLRKNTCPNANLIKNDPSPTPFMQSSIMRYTMCSRVWFPSCFSISYRLSNIVSVIPLPWSSITVSSLNILYGLIISQIYKHYCITHLHCRLLQIIIH